MSRKQCPHGGPSLLAVCVRLWWTRTHESRQSAASPWSEEEEEVGVGGKGKVGTPSPPPSNSPHSDLNSCPLPL